MNTRLRLFFWINSIHASRPWWWWTLRPWRQAGFYWLNALKSWLLAPDERQIIAQLEENFWQPSTPPGASYGIGYWIDLDATRQEHKP